MIIVFERVAGGARQSIGGFCGLLRRFTPRNDKAGFTLAEVLITLVIIGVIAALTIPNLLHNYQTHALKTGFLKAYRNCSEVVKLMTTNLNVENLAETYAVYDGHSYTKTEEFIDECKKYFRVVKTIPYGNKTENNKFKYKNYTANYIFDFTNWRDRDAGSPYSTYGIHILPDGSSINIKITGYQILFTIDTNGPYKKPNREGYDVFTFYQNKKKPVLQLLKQERLYTPEELEAISNFSYMSGTPCSEHSSQNYNGIGCAWYAFHDINADDSTKPYWKSLKW